MKIRHIFVASQACQYLNLADLANHGRHGKIETMTMPEIKDTGPTLAELGRYMQDFRQEFRHFGEAVVRKDVYQAEQAAIKSDVSVLRAEFNTDRSERRGNNNKILLAILVAGLSLISNIIMVVIK